MLTSYIQRRNIKLIFRFIILFLVTARKVLHALMLRQMQQFYHAVLCSSMYPPLCLTQCVNVTQCVRQRGMFRSCCFKTPPLKYPVCSGWSALTRLSQHYSSCLQLDVSCFPLPVTWLLPWIKEYILQMFLTHCGRVGFRLCGLWTF